MSGEGGQGRGVLGGKFPLPLIGTTLKLAIETLRGLLVDDSGRAIIAGVRQGSIATPQPIPSVPFYPQTGQGQILAIGAAAVTSAALTANREHCFWAEQNCWVRIGAGAAVLDFPVPAGAVFTITPTAAGVTISVIEMAALGGNLYLGQSEQS